MEGENEKSLSKAERGRLSTGKKVLFYQPGLALISRANVQHCISSPGKRVCKPPSHNLHPSHTYAKELKQMLLLPCTGFL